MVNDKLEDKAQVVKGKYAPVNWSKLESLFPGVQEAQQRRQIVQNVGQYDKENIVNELYTDLDAANIDRNSIKTLVEEAQRTDNYRQLAQIAPGLVDVRYANFLGPFNVGLFQYPEEALNGAPEDVYRAAVGSVNKSFLVNYKFNGYDNYKSNHLEILSETELIRDLESNDKEKRINAGNLIFNKYINSLDLEKADPNVKEAFRDFAKAIGIDRIVYQENLNKKFEGFIKMLSSVDDGRFYLATVARSAIPEIVTRKLSGNL